MQRGPTAQYVPIQRARGRHRARNLLDDRQRRALSCERHRAVDALPAAPMQLDDRPQLLLLVRRVHSGPIWVQLRPAHSQLQCVHLTDLAHGRGALGPADRH